MPDQRKPEAAPEITDELIAEAHDITVMPADMPGWMGATITRIDRFSRLVGQVVCWLTIPLFGAMVVEIFLRYVFVAPTIWAYDMSRMMYGALFMLGAGYALSRGVHIRADFIYRNFTPRMQGAIDGTLYILFYFPGLLFFLAAAVDFSWAAWLRGERGMDTAWMPYVAPVKTALPAGIVLLLIQGVSELLKCFYAATRNRWPHQAAGERRS